MTALMSSAYASMFGGCSVALTTPERQVLAERLSHDGYWTAGFTANPICGSIFGFHRGFGKFRCEERKAPPVPGEAVGDKRNWRRMVGTGIHPRELDTLCDAAHMTDMGLRWIGCRKPDEPYFLWLHYMDPHWPCLIPEYQAGPEELHDAWYDRHVFRSEVIPRRGEFDPGADAASRWTHRYRQAVASTDREIGRLLDGLRSRPDWDRTIVTVTGDHGEEFYEHGTWHHAWNKLYREGIHIPLIIRVPDTAPIRLAQPVSNLDIAPTLLDYAEASQDRRVQPMMGSSLRPMIGGQGSPGRPVFSEMLAHPDGASFMVAILDGEWKYVYDLDKPHHSRLFRITDDPGELHNLRETFPDVFRRFEKMRLSHVSLGLTRLMKRRSLAENDFELDDVVREQMIALGYMQEE